ncbi:MAG: thioredoxin, partial [Hymenobacter sp.]|nr:thioredoxin [Hymenobacter sp.]
ELGAAIRVLTVDEVSHPSVVHSFHATDLPCFVLVRQGVELLRQGGLPEGEALVPLLLSALGPVGVAAVE